MLTPPDIKKKILRKMKYTSDQQDIMNRYLSEGNNWEDHLYRTRTFIQKCLEGSDAESVAVLGSGWLLDLPLEFLRDNFKTLYLVDIVHPPQIINKIVGMENIKLHPADITGGAVKGAYNLVKEYRKTGDGSIRNIECKATLAGVKADYYISLNILNQLDILIVNYISRFMEITEDDSKVFRKRIQDQHIALLPPGRSCLITNFQEQTIRRDGQPVSLKPLIYAELPEGSYREEWTWNFDTRGAYTQGKNTSMMVQAIKI